MIVCANCRFWVPHSGMKTQGDCRVNPPAAILVPTQAGPQAIGLFPPTPDSHCCGKGQADGMSGTTER